jgi:mannose PTS system EIIA component
MMDQVRIIVMTHGTSGAAMLAAVGKLMGVAAVADFEALEVPIGEAKIDTAAHLDELIAHIDRGAGVLVVCDLCGSTPSNCAGEVAKRRDGVVVLGGVNLPMLLKLASISHHDTTPAQLAQAAADTATKSIKVTAGSASHE